jgi:hypothetical protein
MADFLLGHEGTITLTNGTNKPIAANVFRWSMANGAPLVDVTPSGATFRTYKAGLKTGAVYLDIQVDGDAATPPVPDGSEVDFEGLLKTGKKWAGKIKLENANLQSMGTVGDAKQYFRYTGRWNSAVTVT